MVKIAPSILSANFSKLGEDIVAIEKYGADLVHIDVMDGKFVPNISFGFPIIKAIRPLTQLKFDVHLMIEEPTRFVDEFIAAGADLITIHYESEVHIDRAINYIKDKGVKVGLAINPGTPVSLIEHLIPSLDLVLVMSVNPGYGGQKFIPYCLDKIAQVRRIADRYDCKDILIQVDGGVGCNNIKEIIQAGANVVVAGSAVFRNNEIEKNIKDLRESSI